MKPDEVLAERIDELRAALRSEHWKCLREVLLCQHGALVDSVTGPHTLPPPMPIELCKDPYLFGKLQAFMEAQFIARYFLCDGDTIYDRQIAALTSMLENLQSQPETEQEQTDLGDIQPDREIL